MADAGTGAAALDRSSSGAATTGAVAVADHPGVEAEALAEVVVSLAEAVALAVAEPRVAGKGNR
jgi:hypothetical protein